MIAPALSPNAVTYFHVSNWIDVFNLCARCAYLFFITAKFPNVFLDPFKGRELILEGEIQRTTVVRYDYCEGGYDHGL